MIKIARRVRLDSGAQVAGDGTAQLLERDAAVEESFMRDAKAGAEAEVVEEGGEGDDEEDGEEEDGEEEDGEGEDGKEEAGEEAARATVAATAPRQTFLFSATLMLPPNAKEMNAKRLAKHKATSTESTMDQVLRMIVFRNEMKGARNGAARGAGGARRWRCTCAAIGHCSSVHASHHTPLASRLTPFASRLSQ